MSSFSKNVNRAMADRRAHRVTMARANKHVQSAARVGHTNVVATLIDTRLERRHDE
jgi:hypothetical protein